MLIARLPSAVIPETGAHSLVIPDAALSPSVTPEAAKPLSGVQLANEPGNRGLARDMDSGSPLSRRPE
ncbi:MAG: hypothetical protein ACOY3L_02785 [Pseudomonadota bacterium]